MAKTAPPKANPAATRSDVDVKKDFSIYFIIPGALYRLSDDPSRRVRFSEREFVNRS